MSKFNDDMIGTLTYLGFIISLMNLDENLTQGDKQDLIKSLNDNASIMLYRIKNHLDKQDRKLDYIMEKLK